eukprot:1295084-Karenia_brevis.AAC.1
MMTAMAMAMAMAMMMKTMGCCRTFQVFGGRTVRGVCSHGSTGGISGSCARSSSRSTPSKARAPGA